MSDETKLYRVRSLTVTYAIVGGAIVANATFVDSDGTAITTTGELALTTVRALLDGTAQAVEAGLIAFADLVSSGVAYTKPPATTPTKQ
jgi:hypothetical protein